MPRKKKEVLEEIERRLDASNLISDEEKAAIREKAAAHVKKAKHDKALDALLAEAIKIEEREYEPTEQIEDFHVDLPPFAPYIAINHVQYFHGLVYEVPYSVARSMAEIQWAAWQHENEKDGKSRHGDLLRKPRMLAISPSNPNGVTTSHSIRARA